MNETSKLIRNFYKSFLRSEISLEDWFSVYDRFDRDLIHESIKSIKAAEERISNYIHSPEYLFKIRKYALNYEQFIKGGRVITRRFKIIRVINPDKCEIQNLEDPSDLRIIKKGLRGWRCGKGRVGKFTMSDSI